MKTNPTLALLAGWLLVGVSGGSAFGATTIVSDTYTASNVGNGFALGQGLNSGINPPNNTRLTGTAAAALRYIRRGNKPDSPYTIASNKANITSGSQSGRFTISADGINPYDFGPILGAPAATPANPAVYTVSISLNNKGTTGRMSFAFGTTETGAGGWNFGIQLLKSGTAYNVYKRIDTAASGLGSEVNLVLTNTGTAGSELSFLMRITDAGPETSSFSSRVQLSLNGGTTWFYDTQTDTDLPNGWRLDAATRYFSWDQAGNDGADTYDNFAVTWISGPPPVSPPATRTWTGGGTDANWSTDANWLGGTAPSSGEYLIFSGTTRQANLNDFPSFTTPAVTFVNGGFALSGTLWTNTSALTNLAGLNTLNGDLAWGSTLAKVYHVAAGSELLLNNLNSVDVNGDHYLYGGGTLHLKGTLNIGQGSTANPAFVIQEGQLVVDGGTFASRGGYRIGSMGTATLGAQTILSNNATMNLTAAGANLRLGDSSNAVTCQLVVDHSTLNMAGSHLYVPYATGATGIVSQVGGTISGCQLNFGNSGAGLGAYTNQNGTLEAFFINEGASGVVSYMYFDNAVLRALGGATNAFMSGLNRAEILAGGLTIDAQADVVIAQKFVGAGALTKTGPLALTLNGANTYAGNTLVSAGKLVLPTGQTYPAAIQVADNAELGITVSAVGAGLTNGTLTLGGGNLSTLSFDLGTAGNPTAPLLTTTNLTATGVVTVNIANGLLLQPGRIVLVDYSGGIGGRGFVAFVLGTLPNGVTAQLVNNTANSSIDLNITGVPGMLWTGTISGDWDGGTQNWIDQRNGLASTYQDGFPTLFLDGAVRSDVNVAIFAYPAAIVVTNNALPYVWNAGVLSTPFIKKYGTNSLTRMEGEADSIGTIELNEGSYVLNNLYDATFVATLTDASAGAGTLVKAGPSTLTMSSTNDTFAGTVLIKEGIVKMTTDRALGAKSAPINIAAGATLDLNDCNPGDQPVTVSGAGVNGQGAIIDTKTGTAVDVNLHDVTLVGDTAFGSSGRWDLRVRQSTGPGPGLRGNGYKLTKVGSGAVSIACQRTTTGYWHMNLGDVSIQQGTLTFAESLTPDNPSAALAIYPGAVLGLYDLGLTNPLQRSITMTNAEILPGGNATDTNILNGAIYLSGANFISVNQAQCIINGAISGDGSLSLAGSSPGTLTLNGLNTYTGDTSVTNCTLAGYGSLAGNLVMYGGTNAPGWDGVGTFTVNGNATLGGTTLMELDRSRSPNSDRLTAGGALAFGGILQVVLGAGAPAPQSGDVYRLFNKGGSGGFTTVSLPHLSSGLSWDTSKLTIDGTLSVTGTVKVPAISSVGLSGTNFVFSGTNGTSGDTYYVLNSTNVAAPLAQWRPVATNVFGPGGSFSFTNPINPALPASFFRVQLP